MGKFKPPGQCPVCGEWVYRGQAACGECGACAKSGWRDDASHSDGLDLPDDNFDYDDFIAREFGGKSEHRIGEGRLGRLWWWAALAVLAALIGGFLIAVWP